jgi:hypothetical protein
MFLAYPTNIIKLNDENKYSGCKKVIEKYRMNKTKTADQVLLLSFSRLCLWMA